MTTQQIHRGRKAGSVKRQRMGKRTETINNKLRTRTATDFPGKTSTDYNRLQPATNPSTTLRKRRSHWNDYKEQFDRNDSSPVALPFSSLRADKAHYTG